jgi:hypothetical protein
VNAAFTLSRFGPETDTAPPQVPCVWEAPVDRRRTRVFAAHARQLSKIFGFFRRPGFTPAYSHVREI